jgi:hypothetical protein
MRTPTPPARAALGHLARGLGLVLLLPGGVVVPALLLARRGAGAPAGHATAPLSSGARVPAEAGAPAPGEADADLAQLRRALDEAARNCAAAAALARGAPAGERPFCTTELETALVENAWVTSRAAGEVDALLDVAAWLAELGPEADEAARRGHTWEDVRFLVGGVHWYLERAFACGARSELARRADPLLGGADAGRPLPPATCHLEGPEAYDRPAMRALDDVETFEDLLRVWSERHGEAPGGAHDAPLLEDCR